MLESTSNLVPWKYKLQLLLEKAELLYLVEKDVVHPTNPKDLAEPTRKSAKQNKLF
jgi:hypothetical protein